MDVRKILFVGAAMSLMVVVASAQSGKVCAVQQYGAKGDGTTLDTTGIQKAIDDCAASGGGVVRLAGAAKFVSAPLVLRWPEPGSAGNLSMAWWPKLIGPFMPEKM